MTGVDVDTQREDVNYSFCVRKKSDEELLRKIKTLPPKRKSKPSHYK